MADLDHVAKLKEGVEIWNGWKERTFDKRAVDLRGVDLGGVDLSGANLSGVNLSEVNFTRANLSRANLTNAFLYDAKLIETNLSAADLSKANLMSADLTRANLTKAILSYADLQVANLRDADLGEAVLFFSQFLRTRVDGTSFWMAKFGLTFVGDVDLSRARNLESCEHQGSSIIDNLTLAMSGSLPLAFLRGVGLPDTFINYIPSLFGRGIEFYSCFISYSTKDQEFADRLYADLQNEGVRCWFAPHDIQSGKKVHAQIDQAIRVYDRLLLILSPHSMSSRWVKTEIANAREREQREDRQMLFPIRLVDFSALRDWRCFDADTGIDSAREIREYYVPDFSNWQDHGTYRKEFEKLLRDLKPQKK